jgi:hypothetical protein
MTVQNGSTSFLVGAVYGRHLTGSPANRVLGAETRCEEQHGSPPCLFTAVYAQRHTVLYSLTPYE